MIYHNCYACTVHVHVGLDLYEQVHLCTSTVSHITCNKFCEFKKIQIAQVFED